VTTEDLSLVSAIGTLNEEGGEVPNDFTTSLVCFVVRRKAVPVALEELPC
jgi:hypothetical protein